MGAPVSPCTMDRMPRIRPAPPHGMLSNRLKIFEYLLTQTRHYNLEVCILLLQLIRQERERERERELTMMENNQPREGSER